MNNYKTLREIDGQQYISLAEHEEIIKNLGNFLKAIQDAQAAVASLGKVTSGLASSVGCKG